MSARTMGEAIALSSPSGRMSKRARAAAEKRFVAMLNEDYGPPPTPPTPVHADNSPALLRQRAADYRRYAAGGMRPRAFLRDAAALEDRANKLESGEIKP